VILGLGFCIYLRRKERTPKTESEMFRHAQLLADLTQQDGKAITREPAREAHNYPSWCKMYAVFGTDYTNSQVWIVAI
jgi:hypothetical protein